MAEGPDPVAFDVSDRAACTERHIAAYQLDHHRHPGSQLALDLHRPAGHRPTGQFESELREERSIAPEHVSPDTRVAEAERQRLHTGRQRLVERGGVPLGQRATQTTGQPGNQLLVAPKQTIVKHRRGLAASAELGCKHVADRRDACNRLLGEETQAGRERTHQLPVDVKGAAAHSVGDPLKLHRLIGQADQNDVKFGSQAVGHHAEHLRLEALHGGPLQRGLDDAGHTRANLIDGHDIALGMNNRTRKQQQKGRQEAVLIPCHV